MSVRRGLVVALVAALGTLCLPGGAPDASARPQVAGHVAAAADGNTATGEAVESGGYLVLGDSMSAGQQPDRGDDPDGGYPAVVDSLLSQRGHHLRRTNLACSGETAATMVSGGHCAYEAGSQLAAAERFLRSNTDVRLITVAIGGNEIEMCGAAGQVDTACLKRGFTSLGANLPVIMARLRLAAPRAQLVALDYQNPLLASWLQGPQGRTIAVASVPVLQGLSGAIQVATAAVGGRTALVSRAFHTADFTLVRADGLGTVPRNVATICSLTWVCTNADVHPNDLGYRTVGEAVVKVVDVTRLHPRKG